MEGGVANPAGQQQQSNQLLRMAIPRRALRIGVNATVTPDDTTTAVEGDVANPAVQQQQSNQLLGYAVARRARRQSVPTW
jgi:hypothetical protein